MPRAGQPIRSAPTRRFWLLLVLVAACVSGGISIQMRRSEREAVRAAAALAQESPEKRESVIQIGQMLRAMKLITVEVRSMVESASVDETWRGDVRASVRAPVTYCYGVDLSQLGPDALRREPLTGTYTIRVARPVRLATEVQGGDEQTDVTVSGTRFRDLAGEFHLGKARAGLYEKARAAKLGEIDRRRLDETTKLQVAGMIRALAGNDASVRVEFAETEPVAGAGEPK